MLKIIRKRVQNKIKMKAMKKRRKMKKTKKYNKRKLRIYKRRSKVIVSYSNNFYSI